MSFNVETVFLLLVFLLTDKSASQNCWHEVHSKDRVTFIIYTARPTLKPEKDLLLQDYCCIITIKVFTLLYFMFFLINAIVLSFYLNINQKNCCINNFNVTYFKSFLKFK